MGRVVVTAKVENLADQLEVRDGLIPEENIRVMELDDALIGQLPLEMLDFYLDPAGQRLIGNPEHGGEHVIDMF